MNRILIVMTLLLAATCPVFAAQPFAVVSSRLADIHESPGDNSARLTQALYGELVDIQQNRADGWTSVTLYWQKNWNGGNNAPLTGWTRTTNLALPAERAREEYIRNTAVLFNPSRGLWVPLYERSAAGLRFALLCPEGTLLPVTAKSESEMTVLLADGREGVVSASNVRMLDGNPSYETFSRNMLAAAVKFLGRPALPGANGPDGLDGSGLVHLAARIAGRILPRDEAGITEVLRQKDRAAIVPGDIVMLQHALTGQPSVALYEGDNMMLTAASTNLARIPLDDRTWQAFAWRGFADARGTAATTATATATTNTVRTTQIVTNETTIVAPIRTTNTVTVARPTNETTTKITVVTRTNAGTTAVKTMPATNAPAMYSIHLASMLEPANAVRMLEAIRFTALPVFLTIAETEQGQFYAIYAGWFADEASARQAHAADPYIRQAAPTAIARHVPTSILPWSAGARLYSVQLMSLRDPFLALENMRALSKLGLTPVLRYIPLSDGRFWSVIHGSVTVDRNAALRRLTDLARRGHWQPIIALFP